MTRTYYGCVGGKVVVTEQQEAPDGDFEDTHPFTLTRYSKLHPHVELWVWEDE